MELGCTGAAAMSLHRPDIPLPERQQDWWRSPAPPAAAKPPCSIGICGLVNEEDSHWTLNCDGETWQLSGLAGARQMHQLIAYAPQNAVLFEASLRDNLLLGSDHSEAPSKPGCSGWGWPTCSNAPADWRHHWPWRRIPSPAARFIGWGCCGPGCATNRSRCSMNRPPFWMPRPLHRCVP